jgi:hypothetical protein
LRWLGRGRRNNPRGPGEPGPYKNWVLRVAKSVAAAAEVEDQKAQGD